MSDGNVIETLAGVAPGTALGAAVAQRAEILALSEASHDAVIMPRAPGGLGHGARAALAARMARLHRDEALAAHYDACLARAGTTDELLRAADPVSEAVFDPRLGAMVRHIDLLTLAPRDARHDDIEALRRAGLDDADIVRLSELAAFVNYQVRVIAGLKLLRGA